MSQLVPVTPESPAALIDRELSWLSFARRVLALAEDPEQPVLERVKFAGIMGMIYDEFAMKRIGGLVRKGRKGERRRGSGGMTPAVSRKPDAFAAETSQAITEPDAMRRRAGSVALGLSAWGQRSPLPTVGRRAQIEPCQQARRQTPGTSLAPEDHNPLLG